MGGGWQQRSVEQGPDSTEPEKASQSIVVCELQISTHEIFSTSNFRGGEKAAVVKPVFCVGLARPPFVVLQDSSP